MRYRITYQPMNRIQGVTMRTVTYDSAVAAWKLVDGLMRSDEKVEIECGGEPLDWQELRRQAEEEDGRNV